MQPLFRSVKIERPFLIGSLKMTSKGPDKVGAEARRPVARARRAASDASIPLYEMVKRQISEQVLEGIWKMGDVLPGEDALSEQYGVAVGTVRRALADLTAEGMVTRRKRTGTVITGRMPQHSMRFFYQFFRLHRSDGKLVTSVPSVLSLEQSPANTAETKAFDLAPAALLIRIKRLRIVACCPVMHETIAIPADRLPGFTEQLKLVPDLLYVHLLERYDIRISAVREKITAELASQEDETLLGLEHPSAVLAIDARAYDQSDRLCIITQHRA